MFRNPFLYILAIFFFSCEEPPEFPTDGNSNIDPPVTTIVTQPGTIFTESTVTIQWAGNETARIFDYQLKYNSIADTIIALISDAIDSTSITFDNLDEGDYTFIISGRYNTDNTEDEQTLPFIVNAITGSALRIYPMDQEVDRDSSFQLYVYASNIQNILIGEIYIEFDNSIIEYNASESSCGFNENYIPDYGTESVGDTGNSGYILYYCNFNDSDVELDHIVKINFTRIGDGNTEVIILDNSIVRDSNGNDIEVEILQNGWVR